MSDATPTKADNAKIDMLIPLTPLQIGGRRIQPVARLRGWEMNGGGRSGHFASQVGRLTPFEVRVDDGDAQTVVPVENPTDRSLRGMATTAAALALICMVTTLLAELLTRKTWKRRQPHGL